MSLQLTVEQHEKLRKLDEEMKRKKEYDERNRTRKEASSKATGIPLDIVDMDVIKIGTLLGIIKKKSILEGKEPNTGSLLSILLGDNEFKVDHSKIPKGFRNAPLVVTETDKINYHQQYVHQQCKHLSDITMSLITQELRNINSYILFNINSNTIDNFKTACVETLDVLMEELCEEEEDIEDLWLTITALRNALLGVVDICEYKKILNDQILTLRKVAKPHSQILSHLSLNDVRFSLYQGCLLQTKGPLSSNDVKRLLREVELRCYMKPPELKPFDFDDIVRHCCIPSLLCLPIDIVIEYGLVGPYKNNSIGFLKPQKTFSVHWSFYNLKNINSDGVRFWVLDNKLWMLTDNMLSTMTSYIIRIFRTFYYEYYGSNKFHQYFWLASFNNHYDAFLNMMNNISFLSNHEAFHNFLINVLIAKSTLIPTEYDFFNHIMFYEFPIVYESMVVCFEENMNKIFDDLTSDQLNKLKVTFGIK
jgi:hypothetical protein